MRDQRTRSADYIKKLNTGICQLVVSLATCNFQEGNITLILPLGSEDHTNSQLTRNVIKAAIINFILISNGSHG